MAHKDSIVVASKSTKSNKHWTYLVAEFPIDIDCVHEIVNFGYGFNASHPSIRWKRRQTRHEALMKNLFKYQLHALRVARMDSNSIESRSRGGRVGEWSMEKLWLSTANWLRNQMFVCFYAFGGFFLMFFNLSTNTLRLHVFGLEQSDIAQHTKGVSCECGKRVKVKNSPNRVE